MTITEQKAFLQQYTGKAQAPAGFAQNPHKSKIEAI